MGVAFVTGISVSDSAGGGRPPARFSRHFTVEEANRTLVLVGRIVGDITARYGEYLRLRDEAQTLSNDIQAAEALEQLRQRSAELVVELNRLKSELEAIGCVLKDWQRGLVDFPAIREGEEIWLCWKPGEPEITHWHGIDEGFAARREL
jgi:hypothetical protein